VKRARVTIVLAGAAAVWCAAPLAVMAAPAVAAVARAGGWGTAIEVPGLARLSAGQSADLSVLSCGSAGNCAAGGTYDDRSGHEHLFVVSEKNGRWGTAIEVPGSAALNTGGSADLTSLSCTPAGYCAAGGFFAHAFVVSERNGSWGKAIEVPGLGAAGSAVDSLSCSSAGNCAAGGTYSNNGSGQAFVVSEKNGSWRKAIEVPGSAALDVGGYAGINSVSCATAGNCAAAGYYYGSARPGPQAFVVSERHGSWGKAINVPESPARAHEPVTAYSVSCASPGNCAASGFYGGGYAPLQALVVSERNGTWGKATVVRGTATGGRNGAGSVSCGSAGNCVAGGDFAPTIYGPYQAFVAVEKNGSWGKATEVPGSAALNAGGNAGVTSVSCESAGNCAAGGFYRDRSGHQQAFVVSEKNGRWGKAIEVPGSAALNVGGSDEVLSVSCTSSGYCAAGGSYVDRSSVGHAFVVSRT
jgi:hypothetical protein